MSMLAEPRKKQKWSLNPRGKDWSNDTTKFGYKMLEKMGWSIGKGLGANEQGMVEHVTVKTKNDTTGIGFKENEEAWTECQEAFNDFLTKLQETQDSCRIQVKEENCVGNGQSLEFKSKQSRARVHYHKFTRGKDVQRYSSKDLATILGQKGIMNEKSNIQKELKGEQEQDVLNTREENTSIFTVNSSNMNDYFKNKNPHLYNNLKSSNTLQNNTTEDESLCYIGFGFKSENLDSTRSKESTTENTYSFENPCLNLNDSNDAIMSENKTLKKRKGALVSEDKEVLHHESLNIVENLPKKMKLDITVNKKCKEGFVNNGLDLNSQNDDSHIIGNKFEVPREELGLTNNALDLSDESYSKKKVTFNNHVEYSTDSTKKVFRTNLDKFEVDSKKRKKKKKCDKENVKIISSPIGIVNEALDIDSTYEETYDNETNELKNRKEKKRKHRMPILETIEETLEEDTEVSLTTQEDSTDMKLNQSVCGKTEALRKEKQLKKKKKKKEQERIQELEIQNSVDENKEKKKQKKQKKNKAKVISGEIERENSVENKILEGVNEDITVVTKTDLLHEKDEQKQKGRSTSTLGNDEESSIVTTEHLTIENEDPLQSYLKKTPRITKTALKMFFNRGYVSVFPGANLNNIKGYGTEA